MNALDTRELEAACVMREVHAAGAYLLFVAPDLLLICCAHLRHPLPPARIEARVRDYADELRNLLIAMVVR